jgi:RNA polymerase sigma-70 factor (ECF subfamily)
LLDNRDAEWLQKARNGDDDAFTCLVEKYQTPVYHLCFRMLGTPQEAEDAAQETFWRAYQAIRRYDPQRSFITWLLSIAAHYCIDQQRRRRLPLLEIDALPELDAPDPAPNPEYVASRNEQDQLLHQLLVNLNPLDRGVVVLRYWYDLSEEEIAQMLSLTVSAVKSRLHRTRRLLAEQWLALHPQGAQEGRRQYESPTV